MKILWYAKNYSIGGDFIYSQEVVRTLKLLGHTVYWVGYATDYKSPADRIIALPFYYRHPLFTIGKGSEGIKRLLTQLKPDIVHANLAFSSDDFALINSCRDLRVPLVITFHAPFNPTVSLWGVITQAAYIFYSRFFSRADAVIIFSNPQKNYLVKYGVPEKKLHVVFNGVDTEKYKPGEQRFKKELEAKLVILYSGRIETGKNVRGLLEAFQELNLPSEIKLVVMGGGFEEPGLKKLFGNNENIIFTGYIKDERRKLEILQSGDIFVLPSKAEGMSISLLEAMSCGLVPVTSNIASNTTVTGESGVSVDLGNVKEGLKKVLSSLVEDLDKRSRLGKLARERVKKYYSLEGNVNHLLEIYQQLRKGE